MCLYCSCILAADLLQTFRSFKHNLSALCGCRIPEVIVCVISAASLWNQHRVAAVNHLNWTWCDGFCIDCNYVPLPTSSNVLAIILRLYFSWCWGEGRGCYSELGDSPAVSSSMLIESGARSWLQTSARDGSLNGGKQLCVRKLLAQKPQTL